MCVVALVWFLIWSMLFLSCLGTLLQILILFHLCFEGLKWGLSTKFPLCIVTSSSMSPVLNKGDIILVSNASHQQFNTGDIVVFKVHLKRLRWNECFQNDSAYCMEKQSSFVLFMQILKWKAQRYLCKYFENLFFDNSEPGFLSLFAYPERPLILLINSSHFLTKY